ncbi:MAG: hypothetical protein WCI39_12730 [Gallionellaceae bacterium]
METTRTARTFTWAFSKVVNLAMYIAGLFSKADRGDVDILEFEILALSNFVDFNTYKSITEQVAQIKEQQLAIAKKAAELDINALNEDDPLLHDYLHIRERAEVFIQTVHQLYRSNVALSKI